MIIKNKKAIPILMKSGKIIYYWDLVNIIITPLIYDMFTDSFSYHLGHTI